MPESPMSYMLSEIREQPEALERLIANEVPAAQRLADACLERGVNFFFLAARGTSDHAAVYAKYLFEITTGLPVCLAAPSVYTLYGGRVRLDNALVLAVSQSGEAADAIEVLNVSREAGYLTACLTNNRDSSMARAAEHVLYCNAGEERSLPATKTYTTSLAAMLALAAALTGDDALREDLAAAPDLVRQVLALEPGIGTCVERYRYMEECVVLSRGLNQCTALETALKLAETSYIRAHPYSAADFLHGPIAIVEDGYPCLLYAPSGHGFEPMLQVARSLAERDAELIVISDVDEALELATTPLRLPAMRETLSPIVAIVAGQLFAYHLARIKGRDPDRPRGLRKVTVTR